jgi:hypothetical protein
MGATGQWGCCGVVRKINGLMTCDRKPQADPARYRAIVAP